MLLFEEIGGGDSHQIFKQARVHVGFGCISSGKSGARHFMSHACEQCNINRSISARLRTSSPDIGSKLTHSQPKHEAGNKQAKVRGICTSAKKSFPFRRETSSLRECPGRRDVWGSVTPDLVAAFHLLGDSFF